MHQFVVKNFDNGRIHGTDVKKKIKMSFIIKKNYERIVTCSSMQIRAASVAKTRLRDRYRKLLTF